MLQIGHFIDTCANFNFRATTTVYEKQSRDVDYFREQRNCTAAFKLSSQYSVTISYISFKVKCVYVMRFDIYIFINVLTDGRIITARLFINFSFR